MAATADAQQIKEAIVAFSLDGRFPENIAELPPVSAVDLQPAIDALGQTSHDLEHEIHEINEETKGGVSSWVKTAKGLQEDIIRSKAVAADIVRQSETPQVSGEAIEDAGEKLSFLRRETTYSAKLYNVLEHVQRINEQLELAEALRGKRQVLDALRVLDEASKQLDQIGVAKSCRVIRLLNVKAFELKSQVHDVFDQVWKSLVLVDIDSHKTSFSHVAPGSEMTVLEAVDGLRAFKEVDERTEQLWRNLDAAIFAPRMDKGRSEIPRVITDENTIRLEGSTSESVDGLLEDLELAFAFLATKVPADLLQPLCTYMMADVIPRLIADWLTPAVPSSLEGMPSYQRMVERTRSLCEKLSSQGFTGVDELSSWVGNSPTTWLASCRETALNAVRNKLSDGIGETRKVEKVEKQMVSMAEGKELAATGAGAAAESNDWAADWGDAWDEDAGKSADPVRDPRKKESTAAMTEDDGADAWGWDGEGEEGPTPEAAPHAETAAESNDDDDDGGDAWGWGDEECVEQPAQKLTAKQKTETGLAETRELILKETYTITTLPDAVLELLYDVLKDGAVLTQPENDFGSVASTAPGLFSLPTFALALFRGLSPSCYSRTEGGNMYLYNDAMYLSENLKEFSSKWKEREDLTARAKSMLRLDNDIKSLQSFANRSYAAEMNVQKTVVRDLLGGAQSIMQLDEAEGAVETTVDRIRTVAATWEEILARSVWCQGVGLLAETLATKLIADVLEMSSMSQDDSYNGAKIIKIATQLDELFMPSRLSGVTTAVTATSAKQQQQSLDEKEDEIPSTAQYAPSWLRLQYLCEMLQSNLNEVKYLWLEAELSLEFTMGEVVDFIEASFEANARTKETIREIKSKPHPRASSPQS